MSYPSGYRATQLAALIGVGGLLTTATVLRPGSPNAPPVDPCARWTTATRDSAFRSAYDASPLLDVMRQRGNDAGEISWQVSYLLMADAGMLRTTPSEWFLAQSRELTRAVLASTDSARGIRDWRGESGHGWSNTKYARDSVRTRGPVADGMVAYGLIDVASAAVTWLRSERRDSEAVWWDSVAMAVHRALAEDRDVWREHDGRMIWPDTFPTLGTRADVPINQDVIFAAAEMRVRDLLGIRGAGDDSAKAARFRSAISYTANGAMWPYWWPTPGVDNRAEDVSHGGLDLLYAIEAHERGWLPDTVMRAFGRTFAHYFTVRSGTMPYFVHGRGARTAAGLDGHPAVALWLHVARWNPAVRPMFCTWLDDAKPSSSRPAMIAYVLAIALLDGSERP